MNTNQSLRQKQSLRTLCRFLAAQITYRCMLLLLTVTALILSLFRLTQFAPYGIALFALLLPVFLNNSANSPKKEENSNAPLFSLQKRYRYSPILFSCYRITLILSMALLLAWHITQPPELLLLGVSLPLLYTAFFLALYPLASIVLFLIFHRRLMSGML